MRDSVLTLEHISACMSYSRAYTAVILNSKHVIVCAISQQVARKIFIYQTSLFCQFSLLVPVLKVLT